MSGTDTRFQMEATALAGDFSEPVFFPRRVNDITVKVIPGGGGDATVYYTMDAVAQVKADPGSARWEAWDPGAVSEPTTRALAGPVIALRIGAEGADALLQVVGAYDF